MTHIPETDAKNPLFMASGFWYVWHANLGPNSSATRNRRRLQHF